MIEKILIGILAESDVIHEPIRNWADLQQVSAIAELRRDFRQFGLPLARLGLDSVARKKVEQLRDLLEKSGAAIFHRTLGRRSHWRLSDATDWRIRSIATGWRFSDCLTALLALRELTDCGCTNGKHVGDWHLADATVKKNADRIHDVASILVPAAVRGWVSNWSDGQGRTGYRLTSAGRKFLDQPIKPPVETDFEPAMGRTYLKAFDSAFKTLARLKPRHESCVPIPLPAGDWPDSACRKHIPAIFDSRGNVRSPAAMVAAIAKSRESSK